MWSALRPSERDRQRAIGALRSGYLSGQLSTATFEARVGLAHDARSRLDLRLLLGDLRRRAQLAARLVAAPAPAAVIPEELSATLLLSRAGRDRVLVGRGAGCDVTFGGRGVSREHALFTRTPDGWIVTDLGSRNGTYIDGVRVLSAPVHDGTRVQLADAYLDLA